jgi:hypothetical protein
VDQLRQPDRVGNVLRRIVGDKEVWPAANRIAAWMQRPRCIFVPMVLMPRVMPAKRTTLVEKLARALCAKLARVSDDTPMEYRLVRLIARVLALDYETADAAMVMQSRRAR